jgi:sec-independent protein translocase protein TatC
MKADEQQFFQNHIVEFRKRLIRIVIAAAVGFAIAYYFSDNILVMLVLPLKNNLGPDGTLIFTGLTEMFFIYFKVALVFGLPIAAPYIFYQIWALVSPGIPPQKKGVILFCVVFSCVLFIGGVLFGYFFVFPLIFKFLLGFANENVAALPSIKEYFSLAFKLFLAFGIVFEVPVLVFFLSRIGLVTVDGFRRNRKFAILLAFIIAAFIAPDVVSMIMIAIPIILLYELGIIVAMISGREKKI